MGVEAHGIEIMPEARATRAAAGLITTHADVRTMDVDENAYDVDLASPPCQTFSKARHFAGRTALDAVRWGIARYSAGAFPTYESLTKLTGDERTALVLEPLRIALQGRSMFLAWEQVPPVLPVWEGCAEVLRKHGYSVWTGTLSAEQYGVPQVRRRAILIARRDGRTAVPPRPTHSSFYVRTPDRFDQDVKPWRSMASAIGWGMTRRPYPTLATSRTSGGLDREKVGGSGARSVLYREMHEGRWVLQHGNMSKATLRLSNEPAATIAFGHTVSSWQWKHLTEGAVIRLEFADAAVLQTFPKYWPFAGSPSKQFLQLGNAVPPRLAAAILRTFM